MDSGTDKTGETAGIDTSRQLKESTKPEALGLHVVNETLLVSWLCADFVLRFCASFRRERLQGGGQRSTPIMVGLASGSRLSETRDLTRHYIQVIMTEYRRVACLNLSMGERS